MTLKIADLALKLDITVKELRTKAKELKIELKPTAKNIEEEDAFLIEELIKEEKELLGNMQEPVSIAEKIGEEMNEELEREILKDQKKKKLSASKKISEKEKLNKIAETEKNQNEAEMISAKQKGSISLPAVISVKEFAEKIRIPIAKVIAELMKNGVIVTINHKIDFDTASIIADAFSIKLQKENEALSSEALMQGDMEKLLANEDKGNLKNRPPIISIMGHVDHGKTKLLDYIRKTDVVLHEAGGITQKIGAYQIKYKDKPITFLDTPGHEAFTAMRARGAKATDIAILVIAANEGVKPQTKEAYDHIKEAGIPVIVALNKIDLPDANIDKVKGELAQIGITPEEWGGNTIVVPLSAITGQGVEDLLEMILLVIEMNPVKANPDREAIGTIIESHLDSKLGPIATVLINTGTLHLNDHMVAGEAYGKIKKMTDHLVKNIKEAGPGAPVQIVGFSEVPSVGDILQVEKTLEFVKTKALEVKTLRAARKSRGNVGMSISDIMNKIQLGQLKQLKIILKADSKGSLEAILYSLEKIKSDEVKPQVIHSNVGNISETDILMAAASGSGIVIGFNVEIPAQVKKTAERENIEVRTYRVIYQMIEDIKKILLGLLDPEIQEIELGEAQVIAIFFSDRKGMIVGTKVKKGKVENGTKLRVIRGDKLAGEGNVTMLKREKETVSEVKEGYECGIRFEGNVKLEEGDILSFYKVISVKRESL